jgi:hypothetical protein
MLSDQDGLHAAIGRLITTLDKYTQSSDRYATQLVRLTVILVVMTALLIGLAVVTIVAEQESASLQNNISLNSQVYAQPNLAIMVAVEQSSSILKDNDGQ